MFVLHDSMTLWLTRKKCIIMNLQFICELNCSLFAGILKRSVCVVAKIVTECSNASCLTHFYVLFGLQYVLGN